MQALPGRTDRPFAEDIPETDFQRIDAKGLGDVDDRHVALSGQEVEELLLLRKLQRGKLARGARLLGLRATGGGALLSELAPVLIDATGLSVTLAENPLHCVALGAGRALEDLGYRGVLHAA